MAGSLSNYLYELSQDKPTFDLLPGDQSPFPAPPLAARLPTDAQLAAISPTPLLSSKSEKLFNDASIAAMKDLSKPTPPRPMLPPLPLITPPAGANLGIPSFSRLGQSLVIQPKGLRGDGQQDPLAQLLAILRARRMV